MNEKINNGNEMFAATHNAKEVAKRIMANSLKTRKKEAVTYRPYKRITGIGFDDILSWQKVDFNKIHKSAKNGDGAYIDFDIRCGADGDIFLNVSFNTYVFYNGKLICTPDRPTDDTTDMKHLEISVRKNEKNPVRIFCRKHDSCFDLRFLISVKRYPFMWANDYLFRARAVIPSSFESYEEGVAVSKLVGEGFPQIYEKEYIVAETEKNEYKDKLWYLYTEVKEDTKTEFSKDVIKAFVNGKEYSAGRLYRAKKGDKILVLFKNEDNTFEEPVLGDVEIPWISSDRPVYKKHILLGPFEKEQTDKDIGYDMSKVYKNEKGEKIYWKFADGADLRIYLDSVFYGQWFYALMVGMYGIRYVGKFFNDGFAEKYFEDNMNSMAEYFDYIQYEIEKYKMPTFMPRIAKDDVLDNLGTMGMNFVDAYLDTGNKKIIPIIEHIKDRIENAVPRLGDKTFYRIDTMWADDLYMSCPFLVRMRKYTGDSSWFEKAAAQIIGFKKRLYMEDEKLFSHIYFTDKHQANRVPWGRANGWVMWTLSEVLMNNGGNGATAEIRKLFCDIAESLKKYQTDTGLWRQVLNSEEIGSYIETSCTGMFLLSLIRGVKYKWIDDSFIPCIKKAWEGLLKHSIDSDGNVYGVCMGSGCAMEKDYYYTIPTIINDDHGTGVILVAAAEYYSLFGPGGDIC